MLFCSPLHVHFSTVKHLLLDVVFDVAVVDVEVLVGNESSVFFGEDVVLVVVNKLEILLKNLFIYQLK